MTQIKVEDIIKGTLLKRYDGSCLEVVSVTKTRASIVIETHRGSFSRKPGDLLETW